MSCDNRHTHTPAGVDGGAASCFRERCCRPGHSCNETMAAINGERGALVVITTESVSCEEFLLHMLSVSSLYLGLLRWEKRRGVTEVGNPEVCSRSYLWWEQRTDYSFFHVCNWTMFVWEFQASQKHLKRKGLNHFEKCDATLDFGAQHNLMTVCDGVIVRLVENGWSGSQWCFSVGDLTFY